MYRDRLEEVITINKTNPLCLYSLHSNVSKNTRAHITARLFGIAIFTTVTKGCRPDDHENESPIERQRCTK